MNLEHLRDNKEKIHHLAEVCGVFDIRIFGSVARGDASSGSDVDIVTENAIRDCIFKSDIMRDAIPL